MNNTVDIQYSNLVKTVLDEGIMRSDSTRSVKRQCIYGYEMRFDMLSGFPMLQLKETDLKAIATELIWFLRGLTNIDFLVKRGVNIWNKDAYQHYLKNSKEPVKMSRKEFVDYIRNNEITPTEGYTIGDLGPIYGKNWRAFGASSTTSHGRIREVDQIANLIYKIVKDPNSTELIVTAWNPLVMYQGALRACHHQFQVDCTIIDGKKYLSLIWDQRSVDVALGLPYNIASYALLLHILCEVTGCIPYRLIGHLKNCHLYEDHIPAMMELLNKPIKENKTQLEISEGSKQFLKTARVHRDILNRSAMYSSSYATSLFNSIEPDSFNLVNYEPYESVKLVMHEKDLENI